MNFLRNFDEFDIKTSNLFRTSFSIRPQRVSPLFLNLLERVREKIEEHELLDSEESRWTSQTDVFTSINDYTNAEYKSLYIKVNIAIVNCARYVQDIDLPKETHDICSKILDSVCLFIEKWKDKVEIPFTNNLMTKICGRHTKTHLDVDISEYISDMKTLVNEIECHVTFDSFQTRFSIRECAITRRINAETAARQCFYEMYHFYMSGFDITSDSMITSMLSYVKEEQDNNQNYKNLPLQFEVELLKLKGKKIVEYILTHREKPSYQGDDMYIVSAEAREYLSLHSQETLETLAPILDTNPIVSGCVQKFTMYLMTLIKPDRPDEQIDRSRLQEDRNRMLLFGSQISDFQTLMSHINKSKII